MITLVACDCVLVAISGRYLQNDGRKSEKRPIERASYDNADLTFIQML